MIVSTDMTKSMIISKDRVQCKLEIEEKVVEHIMTFYI